MNGTEHSLREKLQDLSPSLEKWGRRVDSIIEEILAGAGCNEGRVKIKPHFRLKEKDSFVSKALYRDKGYKDPMLEIEDKVATRIVLLKTDDVREVSILLNKRKDMWRSKITKDVANEIEESPNSFDYQSIHLVVWPLADDSGFDIKDIDYLTCEIQIRSLLQHAFAEVSHDSVYKGPYQNDKEIVRKLAKAMALMEATDDYFLEVFQLMTDDKRYYRNLLNEIIDLYKTFNPSFSKEATDFELSDTLFKLVPGKSINQQDIKECVIKNAKDIRTLIDTPEFLLARQPLVLLVAYLAYTRQYELRENWPASEEVLKGVFLRLGISYQR